MKVKRGLMIVVSSLAVVFIMLSCGGHRGNLSKKIAEKFPKIAEKIAEKMELNKEQKSKFDLLASEVRKDLQENIKVKQEAMKIIHENLSNETPNVKSTLDIVKTKLVEHKKESLEKGDKYIDLYMSFYDTLNKDQQSKLNKFIAEHIEKFM